MSRVGKLPVQVSDNIKVSITGRSITFDNGSIKKTYEVTKGVKVLFEDKKIQLSAEDQKDPKVSMFVGMDRSNIKNIVLGLTTPFKTTLEINGVGYKAAVDKNLLVLTLGYSHEIVYALPKGIVASFEKPNLIIISGIH